MLVERAKTEEENDTLRFHFARGRNRFFLNNNEEFYSFFVQYSLRVNPASLEFFANFAINAEIIQRLLSMIIHEWHRNDEKTLEKRRSDYTCTPRSNAQSTWAK